MNRKHDGIMAQRKGEIKNLEVSLDKLNTFKDTKTIREENLAREVARYKALS